ncbi:MAG TPA: ribonucleotide reductase [Thermoanaerobaculia bacterium]|nr:ribonucleotide reductase [Thermoanaerobaculia bacterium]
MTVTSSGSTRPLQARPVDVDTTDLEGIGKVDIDDVIEYVHDTGATELPGYLHLYRKYLKQRWDVYDLDFTQDREDWIGIDEQAKRSFLQIASGFHHGERQVEVELAPFFFGIPEEYKVFLSSHLEDEARHTIFFDRFYREVVGMEGETILDVLDGSYQYISETFVGPFGLLSYLTDELRRNPYDRHRSMQYATAYMLWIEGVLALAVMKITLGYARDAKVLPAYTTGFTATCRDEARHVQAGMRYIRELLDDEPSLVKDLFETLRTLLIMSSTSSAYVMYEAIGWTEERVRSLLAHQLERKLKLVGVELPEDLQEMVDKMDPVLAGG